MTGDHAAGRATDVERTPDGRYLVVGGRRWRATDPSIPETFRAQLVAELMTARRLVADHADGARARVQDAKVALGERGDPWWEPPTPAGLRTRLAATVRALLHHRDPDATICPSDVARAVGGCGWRTLMAESRSVTAELQDSRTVVVRQRGEDVDVRTARGPVRIARGPDWTD